MYGVAAGLFMSNAETAKKADKTKASKMLLSIE